MAVIAAGFEVASALPALAMHSLGIGAYARGERVLTGWLRGRGGGSFAQRRRFV